MNIVTLIGNVGNDPDIRYLDSGVCVGNFSLATNESYTSKAGEKVTMTEWHNIVVWRKTAEIVEKYVTKGMKLAITGKLRTRSYEKDGFKRYVTEVYCDRLEMVSSRPDGEGSIARANRQAEIFPHAAPEPQSAKSPLPALDYSNEPADDLPF